MGDLLKYAKAWARVQMMARVALLIAALFFAYAVANGAGEIKLSWSFENGQTAGK